MKTRWLILALGVPFLIAAVVGCAPTAEFSASPMSGPPPLTVQFTDESGGNPKEWQWYFGDGETSFEESPSHTYNEMGTYNVTLVVSNNFGEDDITKEAYINVQEGTYKEVVKDSITLKWRVDSTNLHVILSAPTTGWVAVGFDPTTRMKSANFIIGYVSSGNVQIRDDYGVSETSHQSDVSLGGTDDVTNKEGSQTDGITEISFMIPRDSGDSFDRPLNLGQTYTVILAYGPDEADDFTTKHVKLVTVTITI